MLTSKEPWSAKGNCLLDFYGNTMAVFTNANDLELVLKLKEDNEELANKIEKLEEIISE